MSGLPSVSGGVGAVGPRAAEAPAPDGGAARERTIVAIATPADIVTAREHGRLLAGRLGFSAWDQTMIASAISELARNVLEFAAGGWIALASESVGTRVGLVIEARDEGPGIADPARAVAGHGLASIGFGLPGVNRLMDELDIASELGKGTTVTARKWRRRE
jgi:serine/threonine-protein kinase RsbT